MTTPLGLSMVALVFALAVCAEDCYEADRAHTPTDGSARVAKTLPGAP